ncbi:MAG: hypothetical protein GKR89_00670 [Candidatus Latescibacteria bacterium]|nr:hypothetical protein [Candidatus Latescibacterota bacterium]
MKNYSIPLSLVGAVLALAGGLAYLIATEPGWIPFFNMGLGVALVVLAGVINPDLFRHYGRWLNALWGAIMVLGITVMVNFLADRYPQRLDWTEGQLHSLSDLTIETLDKLERDVRLLAFMEQGADDALEALLKEYAVHSDRFSFEFIDPDRDPGRTQQYGVRRYNTLVIETDDNQQSLTELTEKDITSVLLKVLRNRSESIYMTVGHGEGGLGPGERSYGALQERLGEIDYAISDSLLLARTGAVPADCAVLVIAGPQTAFLEPEVAAVRRYLENGGAVIALLDPLVDSGLEGLLEEWGLRLGDDFVIDTSGIGSLFGLDFTAPVAVEYGDHPLTRKHQGVMTFYQLVRSVEIIAAASPDRKATELVRTSDQGWAETDLSVLQSQGQRSVSLDEGVDRPGPIALAAAVSGPAAEGRESRLVVFGDADFATNQYFGYQGNGDLLLNAISWLAEDESLISIRPKEAGYNPIFLTERDAEWIFWISVIAAPLLVALVGVLIVSRKGKWSTADLAAAGLGIVLSLGVVGLVNFVGGRYHARYDLTEDQLFTLAPGTQGLIQSLEDRERHVSVKAFVDPVTGMRFRDLLAEYGYLSDRFDFEIIDPQKNTLEVKQYGVREFGTSVIEVTGDGQVRSEKITEQSEEALSNAIQRALKAENLWVYAVGGHSEGLLNEVDGTGYSILKGRLKEMNFQVEEHLDLGEGIPAETTVLVVINPKQAFTAVEVAALQRYLEQGNSALLLLDATMQTGLESLLDEYSIELGQDFVVDLSGLGQMLGADVSVPVVTEYGDHPVTKDIQRGVMSFFPLARSVSLTEHRRRNPEITALVSTHPSSWGETDLAPVTGAGGQVEFDPAIDRRGPVSMGVAVKADADTAAQTQEKSRLVVFGDADFASNQYFGQQANGQLAVSSFAWLAESEDKLDIPAKQPSFNPINLIGNQGELILWLSVFIVPFAVALSGLVIMLRRSGGSQGGFLSWLVFTFAAAAVFFFILGVIGAGEGNPTAGEGYLLLALVSAAVSFGLYRQDARAWLPALALAVINAGLGFVAIPDSMGEVQWLYTALFAANAVIIVVLVWIKKVLQLNKAED